MASPLENFRNTYPNAFKDYTDEEVLIYLHENDEAYKNIPFDRFKALATGLDQEPTRTSTLKYKDVKLPLPEYRRVAAGISETLVGGTADLVEFGIELARGKPLPETVKQTKRDTISGALQNIFGQDIFTVTEDEDGIKYYSPQKPKTTVGTAAEVVGEIAASYVGGKKIIETGAKKLFTKPKEFIPTTGKASAARLAAQRAERLKNSGIALASAELSTQVVLKPEDARLANLLGEAIGDNDNLLGDVIDMLEASDDKTELENRVGLLAEGLLLVGGIGGIAFTAGKVKDAITALKRVKEQGPEAVSSFNKTLINASKSDKATKTDEQFISTQPNETVLKELEYADDYTFTGKLINRTQKLWRTIKGSRGLYTPEMHKIKQVAEQSELAWAKRAEHLGEKLRLQIQSLAGDFQPKEAELNTLFNDFLVGKPVRVKTGTTVVNGKKVTTSIQRPVTLDDLPKELRPLASEIRTTIDELSSMLLQSKRIPKAMKEEIRDNIGRYLRRSYEIFDNPNYRPSQEVYDNAVGYVAKQIAKRETGKTDDYLKYLKNAQADVDEFLNIPLKSVSYTHYDEMFGGPQAKKIFAQRKNLAKPLKDLFGETTDAPTSVFRTIERMSSFYHRTKMYDDFLQAGKGKYFFKEGDLLPENLSKRFMQGRIEGKQFHTLDGYRTTPEIASLFKSVKEITDDSWVNNSLTRPFFALKGIGQASATVGSWYTHLRNTIGGSIIMARNGMNPFSKEVQESFKILQNQFKNAANKEQAAEDLYQEFLRLGLVNQNVRVGDFKSLINDAANLGAGNTVSKQGWFREGYEQGKTKVLSLAKFAEKLYVAEDDLWRIAGFNKELQTLKNANDILPIAQRKSDEVLKQEAAEIIRNTMPTYSLVPPAAKALSKMPIGNFFSFHAEQFRNVYHTLIRSREEIFSGNQVLVERGYKRLAGITTIGLSGGVGLSEATKFAFGVSNEQDAAIKTLALPEWSKNSDIAYGRNPLTGELYYMDLQFTDPTAPVTNLVKSTLNEFFDPTTSQDAYAKRLLNATYGGMKSFMQPFVDEALLTEAALDVLLLVREDNSAIGRRVDGYQEGGGINNALPIFMHVFETLVPATLKQFYAPDKLGNQIYKQLTENNPTTQYGGDLSIGTELLVNATGLRFYRLDDDALQRSLEFKVRDLDKKYGTYKNNIRDSIKVGKSYQDVLDEYKTQNDRYYDQYVKGVFALDAAKELGFKSYEIAKILKDELSNFDKKEKEILARGFNYFQPLEITDEMFIDILDTNSSRGMSYRKLKQQYYKLRTSYSQLPLLELEEYQEKKDDRIKKATGGLIEGPDVPFTKENPADRVDPFTGEPYQEQMSRLGFYSGGNVTNKIAQSVLDFVIANNPDSRLRYAEGGVVQYLLDFIAEQRKFSDLDFLTKYADDVAWQESRGRGHATVQDNDGPARGKYQVEGSQGSKRNETIIQRAKNFYEKYPNAPKTKEIQYVLNQAGKDLDFSTLSEDTQDALFYMDAERGTLPLNDLYTGKLNNRDAWITHWNQDPQALQTIKNKPNSQFNPDVLQKRIDDWEKAQQEKIIWLQQQGL